MVFILHDSVVGPPFPKQQFGSKFSKSMLVGDTVQGFQGGTMLHSYYLQALQLFRPTQIPQKPKSFFWI